MSTEVADKTGMAKGSLRPIIYFENEAGLKLLAPYDKDKPQIARWIFERDRKSTRLNSSHLVDTPLSRMPSSA
jgi:hypothetical protein